MASVTGLTAEKSLELAGQNIVGAHVTAGHLILTRRNGSTIDAGSVIGPTGATGPVGDVSTSELNAAISESGTGVIGIVQEDTEQFIAGYSPDTWHDIDGLSWPHTYTPGRRLQVSFQVAMDTEDSYGSYFEVRALRVGAGQVCSAGGTSRNDEHRCVINGTRVFEIPGTWTGVQTIKLQVLHTTNNHVRVKNASVVGSLSFVDLGT